MQRKKVRLFSLFFFHKQNVNFVILSLTKVELVSLKNVFFASSDKCVLAVFVYNCAHLRQNLLLKPFEFGSRQTKQFSCYPHEQRSPFKKDTFVKPYLGMMQGIVVPIFPFSCNQAKHNGRYCVADIGKIFRATAVSPYVSTQIRGGNHFLAE